MAAEALTMTAAIEPTTPPSEREPPREATGAAIWDGSESPWVLAAGAAAPWPLFVALAWIGVPGSTVAPAWLSGGLAASLALAVVVWAGARPEPRATRRWFFSMLGMGLMAELFAGAVTDFGASSGLAGLADARRALAVWLMCAAVYEVTPILAAAARVIRAERRVAPLDLFAHLTFLGLAAAVFAHPPVLRAASVDTLWDVSPWMAMAFALPLSAARAIGPREAGLSAPHRRGSMLWLLVIVGAAVTLLVGVAASDGLDDAVWQMRWGTRPFDGLTLALPFVSALLALAASLSLLWRSVRVGKAPHGTVTGRSDVGLTLEGPLGEEPAWVAIDGGALPADGSAVTLLGARPRPSGAGPFRDGAGQWRARRAWAGHPDELARALRQRAAKWAVWAVASALGLIAALLAL